MLPLGIRVETSFYRAYQINYKVVVVEQLSK